MKAAIVGGGLIGGGWAARFLLGGWDVAVVDPDAQAERRLGEVLTAARRSLPALSDVALPDEGSLQFCDAIAEVVQGADWVQESVPERIEAKHAVLAEVLEHVPREAVIGSSTSGFKPSQLQEGLARPGQVLVCHPFNPVYLLPLVEVVASAATEPAITARACEVLSGLGMKPLVIRKEIDAHIADRFLEAVWREALWLVRDGVATTGEIDDAIRFGFGLRWAQMGLFETYRLAGGEAGMAHFIAQFGPHLSAPWTRLMDVPDLDEALVEKIAEQSDAQSGGHTIRELARIRDDNLVAILRALKKTGWAAGAVLRTRDGQLRGEPTMDGLVETYAAQVPQSWTDYNGHMNETHYLEVFTAATDRFMELIGADATYIAGGLSYFTVETQIRHLGEVMAGDKVRVVTQVLAGAGRKMHLFHRLEGAGGALAATGEHMLIHVDLATRAACVPGDAVASRLAEVAAAHEAMGVPEGVGRAVGQGR